jgi:diaminohydroxyphosphoribosylaminopyrimidine deaminase/5-amino-6-(5-phosphoribosylamino)uracil reductase
MEKNKIIAIDKKYIQYAFELAKKGVGKVSPNPLVGAVIVKNNKIIGEGYHEEYGSAHAEPNAINSTKESVEGATLYCNLEPCCHTKKQTPPCTKKIIESKIKRVVISNLDPNPMVAGKGVEILKAAGIEVTSGILEEEGAKLNEVFFKYIQTNMPFVHIKLAQTLDGKISTSTGDSKWISDEDARKEVHRMRLKYDAVLIGRKTLNQDNAKLNIRMGVESNGKIPYRIIVGSLENLDLSTKILNDEHTDKTIIITSKCEFDKCSNELVKFFESKNIKIIITNLKDGNINFNEAFKLIGEMKITSILVEGGNQVITTLLDTEEFDKISFFICPKLIGNGYSIYSNNSLTKMSQALEFKDVYMQQINNQVVFNAYKNVEVGSCLQG